MKTEFIALLGIGALALGTATACSETPRTQPNVGIHAPLKPTRRPPLTVRAQATLIAPYALPTLSEFSRSSFVTAVVEGDVIGAETDVRDQQDSVGTTLTIDVSRGWGVSSSTITASEYGGVLPLRKVRGSFEGKEWQEPLTEADLNRDVEYRMEGFPPTRVGDHVVLFLTTKSDGTFALAAKLVRQETSYGWAEGEAPNDAWTREYTPAEVGRFLTAR